MQLCAINNLHISEKLFTMRSPHIHGFMSRSSVYTERGTSIIIYLIIVIKQSDCALSCYQMHLQCT